MDNRIIYKNYSRAFFLKGVFFFFLFSCGLTIQSYAQVTNNISGLPFIQNYSPEEYGADAQNWAIVQDQHGIMYFGNTNGVLEYDGENWRTIETEKKTVIRSLGIDKNNQIFVGAYGEFGYLKPDSLGALKYQSLLPFIDKKYHDFLDVWQTIATDQGVYFSTQKYIFRWSNGTIKVWETETVFLLTSFVNNQIYVREWKTGLKQFVGDALEMVPNGDQFLNIWASVMLPYPAETDTGLDKMLVGTQTQGFFLFDGNSLEPFQTNFDELLNSARNYMTITLPNGNYAIGTIKNGVVIMDKKGHLLQHFNKATGLQNNTAWSLYSDLQDGLWLGLDIGISRLEINAPLTYFTDKQGVEGYIFNVIRHEGKLYIGTSLGLYYLDEFSNQDANGLPQFKQVAGVPPQCWSLLVVGKSLLAGTYQGLFEIKNAQVSLVTPGYVFNLYQSKQDTNRVFISYLTGLGSLYYLNGTWQDQGKIEGLSQEIRDVHETATGKLWLTTRYQGLAQVDLSSGYTDHPNIIHLDTLHGLPKGDQNFAFNTSKGIRFGTSKGIYRFNDEQQHFSIDTTLIKGIQNHDNPIVSVTKTRDGNLWILSPKGINSGIAILQKDSSYLWDPNPLKRNKNSAMNMAYPDPLHKNITWFGGNERLVQYNEAINKNYKQDFEVLLRRVVVNNDSLIYSGISTNVNKSLTNKPKLDFDHNSLQFSYAATSFDDESKNEYQYFLEGYDKKWSSWSLDSQKEYTNLSEGTYLFQVRAKNGYHQISSDAAFAFGIQTPIYKSWWAYLLYGLFFIGIFYAIKKNELKKIAKKHLQEIKILEYDKLKEMEQIKSRFFANISHEFRTPLTLILGPLEVFISKSTKKDDTQEYNLMKRHANNLLGLINQLLDLSKLEAKKMKLESRPDDIIPFIRRIIYEYKSLANSNGVILQFVTNTEHVMLDFDQEKMRQILTNVLSNALKFTGKGDQIKVSIKKMETEEALQYLEIQVYDTGIGISANHLPHIFEYFYQAKENIHSKDRGTGIGLGLTKELVELHQGQIHVQSEEGEGTRFIIQLPIKTGTTIKQPLISDQLPETHITTEVFSNPVIDTEHESKKNQDSAPAQNSLPEKSSDKPIVLIVEDNLDLRLFIRNQLTGLYSILEAVDGKEGLEIALESIPDLIISDVMMPNMDGLDMCNALKNNTLTSHIPIILLTSKADLESRLSGIKRGADAYLSKPVSLEELKVWITMLIEQRSKLYNYYSNNNKPVAAIYEDLEIENEFLQKIWQIMDSELANSDFKVIELCDRLNFSQPQLYRKITALTGKSIASYMRSIRLYYSKKMLKDNQKSIAEIAIAVGFNTTSYFSRSFTEAFGMSPSNFQKK